MTVDIGAGLGVSKAMNMMELGQSTKQSPKFVWKRNHPKVSTVETNMPRHANGVTHLQNFGFNAIARMIHRPVLRGPQAFSLKAAASWVG
jgi:hypothetical protein